MKIEILSVALLETARPLVEQFRRVSRRLDIGLGWHYLLDLTWTAQQLELAPGMRVLDAGAGQGVIQWWLADRGVDVISADRVSRRNLSDCFRRRYHVQGWRSKDLEPLMKARLLGLLPPRSLRRWHVCPRQLANWVGQCVRKPKIAPGSGTIFIYNRDLASMPDIEGDSVDAVVSVSALEHNRPDELRTCVGELVRVLKPGGRLIATLGAAKERDWFHEPSKGLCYTEATLRDIFDLPGDCPSNYDHYDELFEALRGCAELRNDLADFYFKSGNNGMPWGIWDPKYQPVGVVTEKPWR